MADNNELYELTHTVENGEDNFEFDATEAASDLVVSPATFKLTHTRDGNTDEFDFGDGDTPGPTPTGDLSSGTVTFTEAATRDNITSGSTLSILFGKIKKWFSDLKTVAFTGSYNDLSNTPSIPAAQVQSDWSQSDNTKVDYIKNKPSIPAAQVQSDWSQSDNTQVDYIKNKPTIPAAQVNSDWNASSGVAEILHKPTIPTVNNPTITFTQGGVTKGSISLNQAGDETIALDAGGGGGDVPDVTGSATVDGNVGIPGVTVTTTGSGTQADPYNLAFAFTNLKGGTGAAGSDGRDGTDGTDGISPEVTITAITGGHRVTITDADHPTGQSFDVMDGEDGSDGSPGATGPAGPGVPAGGTAGQILSKVNGTDYNTQWINAPLAGLHIYRWHAAGAAYAGGNSFTDIQTDFVLPQGQVIVGCAPKYAGLPQLCVTNFWNNSFNETFYTVWNFGSADDIQWNVAEGIVITADTV